jgi:hypothetical protein
MSVTRTSFWFLLLKDVRQCLSSAVIPTAKLLDKPGTWHGLLRSVGECRRCYMDHAVVTAASVTLVNLLKDSQPSK